MDEHHKHKWKKPDPEVYLLYDSTYGKFNNKWNLSPMLEVRITVGVGGGDC